MSAITYKGLADYFLSQLSSLCGNIGSTYSDDIKGDGETTPTQIILDDYDLSGIAAGDDSVKTSDLWLYSLYNGSSVNYGAPPLITSDSVKAIMQTEFSQPSINIDITSTATRTPKEAVHFINAMILFLNCHVYLICGVQGRNQSVRIAFNSSNQLMRSNTGLPRLTYNNKVEDRDLMIETFNSLCSFIPTYGNREAGIDIVGSSCTSSSSSSSCSSSSCSSSNSSSSSSIFIAYFNI